MEKIRFFFLVALISLMMGGLSWGQTTIFSENMGTPPSTTAITSYTGWQNNGILTFTGSGDVRTTTASSGYTGASGSGNVYLTNTVGKDFQISGINTSSYSNLQLSFGIFKSTTASNGSELVVEVSSDGVSYSPLSFTLATGSGTASWSYQTPTGSIPSTSNLRIHFRQTGTTAQFRIDDVKLTGTLPSGTPTKLSITNVNNGISPSTLESFNVTITSLDNTDTPASVSTNTDVTLSLATGTGLLGGTLTGQIAAGSNSVTISGVTYSKAETGVSITAKASGGDALTDGTSSTFTVLDAASQLAFVGVPSAGQANSALSSFTVEARRSDNSVDQNFTGDITIAKASGAGNISGTLTKTAVAGVAAFDDIQFDASGTYRISASSTGLTGATSGNINLLSTALPLVEDFNYTAGTTLVSNGWGTTSGTGSNDVTVTSGALTYTNYSESGIGNSIPLANTGQDVYRPFDKINSDSVYVSFLINVSAAQSAGDYFIILSPSSSSSSFYARLYAQSSGAGYVLGLGKYTETEIYSSTVLNFGTTYLCVIKYEFNLGSSNDDEVSLFLFADPAIPSTEPGTPEIGPITGDPAKADASNLGNINLRQGSSLSAPTLTVSGIRIATTWDQAPLPVELTSFTSLVSSQGVELQWTTATEVNNYGFEIQKITANDGESHSSVVNSQWQKIGFVKGSGTSNATKNYSYMDATALNGTVKYRLKQIDNNGTFKYSKEIEVNANTPLKFALNQNYPNPFNPSTIISYSVAEQDIVTLKVVDILGREVITLVNEKKAPGTYEVKFDGKNLASGIYFYRMQTSNYAETKKLLLLK